MLEAIKFEPTNETPGVVLDKENSIFEFKGRSLPEDVNKFYGPVKEWLKQYTKEPNKQTKIVFNLDYFNSSSARVLVKILVEMEAIAEKGYDVSVDWYYKENDDVMEDRGDEIKSVLRIPFNLVKI